MIAQGDDDRPAELRQGTLTPLSEMARRARPGDRWPKEPPAPDGGPDESGDREPRRPRGPDGPHDALAKEAAVDRPGETALFIVHLWYPRDPRGGDERWLTETVTRNRGVLDPAIMLSSPGQRMTYFRSLADAQAVATELQGTGRWGIVKMGEFHPIRAGANPFTDRESHHGGPPNAD